MSSIQLVLPAKFTASHEKNVIDYLADRLVTKNAWQRFSPSDLVIGEWLGDIKTSTYFVQVATPLAHDFYIRSLA